MLHHDQRVHRFCLRRKCEYMRYGNARESIFMAAQLIYEIGLGILKACVPFYYEEISATYSTYRLRISTHSMRYKLRLATYNRHIAK